MQSELEKEIKQSDGFTLVKERKYKKYYSLRRMFELQNTIIIKEARINEWNSKVLDLGCGIGNFLIDVEKQCSQALGIEVSLEAAKLSRSRANFSTILLGDGSYIPIKDETIDVVVARGLIHHLINPKKVLREIVRCLKIGGRLIILEGNPEANYRKLMLKIADLAGITHEVSQFDHLPPRKILEILKSFSTNIVKFYPVGGVFIPLAYWGIKSQYVWSILERIQNNINRMFPTTFDWWTLIVAIKED